MKYKIINNLKLYLFVIALGAAVGVILWVFLKAIQLCTGLLWETLPQVLGGSAVASGGGAADSGGAVAHGVSALSGNPAAGVVMVAVCAAGGLIMGLVRRKYGDYPEELPVVLGKIKRDRHYDYHPMPVMLVCAFLPLVFGASVGPEAGLTGIIAGLCYWIGDNVKYAKSHAAEYSDIGAAVMLGTLFHAPLFGIFAVEESENGETPNIPKISKLLLYGLSAATALLVMKGLGAVFGPAGEGFPGYEADGAGAADYAMLLPYVAVGLILFLAYFYSKKLMMIIAGKIPAVVKETICGLCIGGVALVLPAVLFSGEEQMGMLPDAFTAYAPAALIGVGLAKILMTTFCIEFGMKGGHFFPLIYACSCTGFGLALLVFGGATGAHAVFAAAVVTAATLGAQLKKPFAVTMLLMISFPFRLALWIFLSAAIGGKVGALLVKRQTEKREGGSPAKPE